MHRTFSKFAIIGAAFAAIVGVTILITGQPASKLGRQPASSHHVGVVDDWSYHHLVFSNPGTYEQAAKSGASYAKWLAIRYDTRFILQQMKRHAEATGAFSGEISAGGAQGVSPSGMPEPKNLAVGLLRQLSGEPLAKPKPAPKPKPKPTSLKGLWYEQLYTGTVQPNAYPAKYGTSLTITDCNDFVVFPTGVAGSSSAATIVAYNNLYSGCGDNVPSLFWAYNTAGSASGYSASTSPIISEDGSQVAFMKSNGEGSGYYTTLDLLKWGPSPVGTLTSPGCPFPCTNNLTYTSDGSTYRSYTSGPIYIPLIIVDYGIYNTDTYSQPFYDYTNDAIYVGDDIGYLHMFSGVFKGAPAEVTTSPWPVHVSTAGKLTSPVYDSVSGLIFVGDTGGYLYAVSSTTGSFTQSATLGDVIIDGPLVDSSAGMVYAFVTTRGGSNTVYQFPTSFLSGSAGASVTVGTGGTGYYLYAGDFDNVYYETPTTPPSGNLYVVGNTGATGGATLYRIPIISNSMGTPVSAVTGLNSSEYPWPSPLTEFCNNAGSACTTDGTITTAGKDYLFFSVNTGTGCTKSTSGYGCVSSYAETNYVHMAAGTTSDGSTSVTSTSGITAADVGAEISGIGIPTGDSITAFDGTTNTATLAIAANADGTSVLLTITTPTPTVSGSLNVATPTSSGCWATGGIVIDNSDVTNNGAQVYFIGLDGSSAGGAGGATSSKCTSGSGTIQAWQASQSGLK
jgi:hypothetical protein